MRDYAVTVTVTHEATLRARSKQDAADLALALNGAHPLDITDITIDVVDPRSRAAKLLNAEPPPDS